MPLQDFALQMQEGGGAYAWGGAYDDWSIQSKRRQSYYPNSSW